MLVEEHSSRTTVTRLLWMQRNMQQNAAEMQHQLTPDWTTQQRSDSLIRSINTQQLLKSSRKFFFLLIHVSCSNCTPLVANNPERWNPLILYPWPTLAVLFVCSNSQTFVKLLEQKANNTIPHCPSHSPSHRPPRPVEANCASPGAARSWLQHAVLVVWQPT